MGDLTDPERVKFRRRTHSHRPLYCPDLRTYVFGKKKKKWFLVVSVRQRRNVLLSHKTVVKGSKDWGKIRGLERLRNVFVVMALDGRLHALCDPREGLLKHTMKCRAKGVEERVWMARYLDTSVLSEKVGMMKVLGGLGVGGH